MNFDFVRPEYLGLLLFVPAVIFLHFVMLKKKRSSALKFANFEAIARIKGVDLLSKNIVVLSMTVAIIFLLVFSLAGLRVQRTIYSSSFSYVIAIDSSTSMEATDILPSRLEAAKETALSFVRLLPAGTRVAVVSFSGNSFIEQQITEDRNLVASAIESIPMSSVGGTDLEEAVVTSSNLLEGEDAKAVILLSDGKINVGTLENAFNYASSKSVVVHTIGLGTVEGGLTSYGLSKMDEDSLKALAHNTGGKYFSAETKEMLSDSFGQIIELKYKRVSTDASDYLLIGALVLFFLEFILINTRFKSLP